VTSGPLPLGRAGDLCEPLFASLGLASPSLRALEPAGDLRRVEPLANSLVLVGASDDPAFTIVEIARALDAAQIARRTSSQLVIGYRGATVDIRIVQPSALGTTLFFATGSEDHVALVTALGLRAEPHATEAALYASVGLPLVVPELRHGRREIEAALAGGLPSLLDVADMRGDLHMHTTYSDGRDELETMVAQCHALGYEYIAITDHSQGAEAARTLALEEIPRQRDAIEALRSRYPAMTILHGIEVDIHAGGHLDFADEILAGFDIVLASLHDSAGHDAARLTERTIGALRHPLVNVLCHPANRLVGRFEGYALDFDAVFAAAVETGTALEVDGAPSHIDLDGDRVREAIAGGVTVTVDSDCHRAAALAAQMRFGVGTARRGWVEPRHVLNTRPLGDVLAFVAAKRAGGRRPPPSPAESSPASE
jgi:DNA polymerase (family 10)